MTSPHSTPLIGIEWAGRFPRILESTSGFSGVSVAALPTFDLSDVSVDHRQTVVRTNPTSENDAFISWSTSTASGQTRVTQISERVSEFSLHVTATTDMRPNSIGWRVELPLRNPRWLDNQYRLVNAKYSHFLDAWTPLLLTGRASTTDDFVQLVGASFFPAVELSCSGGGRQEYLQMTIWLDHHYTHPRFSFTGERFWNWHNPYTFRPGQSLAARFRIVLDQQDRPAVVCGRYPDRKKAMISITDHADHDTCPKVSALFFGSSNVKKQRDHPQGFAGLGLPFTKTVFTKTDDPRGAGLHNPEFVEICDRAHAAGLEIGPHGIHETVEPPLAKFAELIEPFKKYAPNTWIDHGRSFHCNYRLSGWNPEHEYNLEQIIEPLGIDCIWAGFDFGLAVPNRCLNQLRMENFSGVRFLQDLPRSSWRAICSGRPWAIAHEIAAIVFQMMPDRAMKQYFEMHRNMESFVWGRKLRSLPPAFRELFQLALLIATPSTLREIVRQFFGPRVELTMAPVMYREHETLGDPRQRRWLFNTIAVHDVEDAYSPTTIEQLQIEYGFHIAHTYLASMSRAHLSHALQRHPTNHDHWQLTPAFAANLKNMAQLQSDGHLWVASIGEVCKFWEQLREVSILPQGNGIWQIESSSVRSDIKVPIVVIGENATVNTADSSTLRPNAILASVPSGTLDLSDI